MNVLRRPFSPLAKKPTKLETRPNTVSLDEDLDIFEANHGDSANVLDKQHTLKLQDSLFGHSHGKGNLQCLPENPFIYKHILCCWITERTDSNDVCILYYEQSSSTSRRNLLIEDPVLLSYYKQLFMLEDISEGEFKSEHFTSVMRVVTKFWSYRDELLTFWNCPNATIKILQEDLSFKDVTVFSILNQIQLGVYDEIHGAIFKEAIRKRVRRSTEHFKSAERYLSQLRKESGRLLVIRLDICFPTELKNISVQEVKSYFSCFSQKLRRSSSLVFKGYIWKLEYGFNKSFHYHLIIFLCGRKHCHDIKLAQMIGEMWDKTVNGKNCYFNCHSTKQLKHYRDIVVGRLEQNDHIKSDRLLNIVIRYFCKKDQFIMHKSILHKNTFGTGLTLNNRKKVGRPAKI